MIRVRKGFFETNSSSVHAFILPKDASFRIPDTVKLCYDESCVWSTGTVTKYESVQDKLDYIFSHEISEGNYREYDFCQWLGHIGVKHIRGNYNYDFESPDDAKYDTCYFPLDNIFSSEKDLLRWLFTDDTCHMVQIEDNYLSNCLKDIYDKNTDDYFSIRR